MKHGRWTISEPETAQSGAETVELSGSMAPIAQQYLHHCGAGQLQEGQQESVGQGGHINLPAANASEDKARPPLLQLQEFKAVQKTLIFWTLRNP